MLLTRLIRWSKQILNPAQLKQTHKFHIHFHAQVYPCERKKKKHQQAVPKMFRRKCKWWCFHFKRRKVSKIGFYFFKDSLRNLWRFANHLYDLRIKNLVRVWNCSPWFCARGPLLCHLSVKSSGLWKWSVKLYEPRVPPATFLMDSSTAAQKLVPAMLLLSFEGSFVEIFEVQM